MDSRTKRNIVVIDLRWNITLTKWLVVSSNVVHEDQMARNSVEHEEYQMVMLPERMEEESMDHDHSQ